MDSSGFLIPRVVREDVQMLEDVGAHQLSLIEQKDGMDMLTGEFLDMVGQGPQDSGRGGLHRQAQGQAQLAVEVAATQCGVVAVQSEAGLGQSHAKGPEHAGLANAGLPDDEVVMLVQGLDQVVDDVLA